MAYIGTPPQSGFITTAKQRVTSSTNNYVDLDNSISSLADVIVWVNSVKQDSTNLTLTTSTRITLGGTLTASDVVEIAYLGKAVATQTPDTGTVTNDMLAGSIANSKLATDPLNASNLASGTVPTARLGSGTASSSTVLYGDNTFKAEPSGGFVRVGGGESGGSAVSVSSVSFNNVFTTTYDTYFITLFSQCATNNSNTYLRLRASGTDITASNYMWVSGANASVSGTSASSGQTGNTAATNFQLGQWGGNTAYGNYHTFYIYNPLPQSTDTGHGDFPYIVGHKSSYTSDNYQTYQTFSGILAQGTGGDGLTFYEGEGNVVRYTINIYGMVQS